MGERVIAVTKPPGMEVASRSSRRTTLLDIVRKILGPNPREPGRAWALLHLDKEASGLVLFARDLETVRAFRAGELGRYTRLYRAVVVGEAGGAGEAADVAAPVSAVVSGTMQSRITINRRGVAQSLPPSASELDALVDDEPEDVADLDEDGQGEEQPGKDGGSGDFSEEARVKPRRAVTHYRVEHAGEGLSLLRLRAETDHRMQLRAHLAERGWPVLGDKAYAAPRDDLRRVALHADELILENERGKRTVIRSTAPASFWETVGATPPADAPRETDEVRTAEGGRLAVSWDHVAEWYEALIESGGSDLHDRVVHPGALRLLEVEPGDRVLDVACGSGAFCRALHAAGAVAAGVDASPKLIDAARERSPVGLEFLEGDARDLRALADDAEPGFDGACCLLAAMNIDPLERMFASAADLLRPGGRFVLVVIHPAFRSPEQTAWGWVGETPEEQTQFRRVDAYLSARSSEVTMNPGAVASGGEPVLTVTHHRPVQAYVNALASAGLLIDAMEEWASPRSSAAGPRAEEENRARAEIPMFLALRAVKVGSAVEDGAGGATGRLDRFAPLRRSPGLPIPPSFFWNNSRQAGSLSLVCPYGWSALVRKTRRCW